MSTALLDAVVKKNRVRLIPFMLALYVLAFLDRSNIGFAKQTYQIDTGLSNEAAALLIDELHGIRKFHIFDFDKVLQRIDAAHFIVGPPAPFSVGDLQTVVAAEFICVWTGGDQLVRLVSAQKGQQVRLTGALNL